MRWWERVGAWDETHRFAVDAVGAALLGLLVVPVATLALGTFDSGGSGWWAVAMVVPLAWRRIRPAPSAAAVFGVALLHVLVGVAVILPSDLLVLVSLYSVTVYGPVWAYRTAITGTLVGSAALAAVLGAQGMDPAGSSATGVVAGLLGLSVFAFALVRRSRREAIDSLVDRARRLEIERDQQAQIATAAERARIAREMHDIVAHSLSVIIAQADGGRYAAGQDPESAGRALTTIAETGRNALTDMRRLLGVLRPAAGDGEGDEGAGEAAVVADLTPQPAADDVERLVEQVRDSGLRVSLVRMGTPRTLPPGTGLTLYRICQESLTNVLKHAGPTPSVTVLLQWTASSVVLEVTDDGRGAAAVDDGGGQGLVGMRERAAMLGGTLSVGPRPGGGYRVRAQIPLPPVVGGGSVGAGASAGSVSSAASAGSGSAGSPGSGSAGSGSPGSVGSVAGAAAATRGEAAQGERKTHE